MKTYIIKGISLLIGFVACLFSFGLMLEYGVGKTIALGVGLCVGYYVSQILLLKKLFKISTALNETQLDDHSFSRETNTVENKASLYNQGVCPHCGETYNPEDYSFDVPTWLCSSCKAILPKGKP